LEPKRCCAEALKLCGYVAKEGIPRAYVNDIHLLLSLFAALSSLQAFVFPQAFVLPKFNVLQMHTSNVNFRGRPGILKLMGINQLNEFQALVCNLLRLT